MQIDVQSNIKDIIKRFDNFQKRDLPYITATTLNNIAFDVIDTIKRDIAKELNIKKRAIPNALRVKKATKKSLYAELYVDEFSWQHSVLKHHFFGGDRERKGMEKALIYMGYMHKWEILTPSPGVTIRPYVYVQMMSQLKLNYKAGFSANETQKSRKRNKTTTRFFIITGKSNSPLAPGIYARRPGYEGVICMLRIAEKPNYKKRFDLEKRAQLIIASRSNKHFRDAINRANSIRKKRRW